VNPGALGLPGTLSVFADVTFGLQAPYDAGSPVQQFSFGLNSYFLAFSYQFDRLPDALGTGTIRGYAVRLALWGRHEKTGGGGTITWYSGGDGGVGFDAGVLYRANSSLDLGAVIANIGQPTVRGIGLLALLRPAVNVHTPGGAFALQAQGEVDTYGLRGFAFGTAINLAPVHITVRLDTNAELQRESFTFGLSVGGETRVGTLATTSGDLSDMDAGSLHLTSEKSNQPKPRRGR
jgi:hypothetical protein